MNRAITLQSQDAALADPLNDSTKGTPQNGSARIDAAFKQGKEFHQQGKLADAETIYREILALLPDHFGALHLLGVIALQTQHPQQAFDLISKAIGKNDNHAIAHCNLGNTLLDLKRPNEALACFEKAISLDQTFAMAHSNRAKALLELNRSEDALASCETALALMPTLAEAHNNRGMALGNLRRPEEALASCDKAIALRADFAEAYNNRGNALLGLGYLRLALESYEKATALNPNFSIAHHNRGMVLQKLNRFDEAFAAYDLAYTLEPNLPGLEGGRLFAKMALCNWSDFHDECARLIATINNKDAHSPPFEVLAIATSAADQLKCAKTWAAKTFPRSELPERQHVVQNKHTRIRVAYLSADFRDHAVSILLAGVFEQHDRSQFETFGISFSAERHDLMTARLKTSFDQFINVENMNDVAVAKLLHELEIDIAIDLMGYTAGSRMAIFALCPSPIQVSFLGYPGTTGTNYIDYLITDNIVIPVCAQANYSEKLVYLPNAFIPTDATRAVSAPPFSRADFGLPEFGVVFCCFNNSYKLNPSIFSLWLGILGKVDDSVLWLSESNSTATANLRKAATINHINPNRLIFAKRVPLNADHLARHRLADLFLDTLPFNAHTTAIDALWAGLPVITQIGETFAGRVAASLLTAIGLPELITSTSQDYASIAVELANNPEKLCGIKQKLASKRLTSPLFDTKLFTKHIETAFKSMYERHHTGLQPDHIYVPD